MGCFVHRYPLWIPFVCILSIPLTTDGVSITWYEPLPVQTLPGAVLHSNTTQLLERSINASLSWNFSLSSDLNFEDLALQLDGGVIAAALSSGESQVQSAFKNKFGISWIPSQRVTLIIFNVTTQLNGTSFSCAVNAREGFFPQTFRSNIQVVVVDPPSNIVTSGNQTVTSPDEVTLNCSADGKPKPNLSWTRLSGNAVVTMPLNISGIVDGGFYRCTADNGVGSPLTKDVFINVLYEPSITSISRNLTVNESDVVSLICIADGNPEPTITWTRLSDNSTVTMPLSITGKQDAGTYRCTADNDIGSPASSDVFLGVTYEPNITSISRNQTVNETDVLSLICIADGNPQPTIIWTRLSDNIAVTMPLTITGKQNEGAYRCTADNSIGSPDSSDVFLHVENYHPISTSLSTNLPSNTVNLTENFNITCSADASPAAGYRLYREHESLTNITDGQSHTTSVNNRTKQVTYRCIPFNFYGDGPPKTVNVTVHYNPADVTLVANTTENKNCSLVLLVNFTCEASEANPPVENYQLYGNRVLPETSSSGTWIKDISEEGTHVYGCRAQHSLGNVTSSKGVTVTFNVPVQILVQLRSGSETLTKGGNLALYCDVSGYPKPTVIWSKLSADEYIASPWLNFTNIDKDDAGEYICHANNTCGKKQCSSRIIDVQFAPENVTLRKNLSTSDKVCADVVVNFTCTVEDANPAVDTYTLYENGSVVQNMESLGVWIMPLNTGGQVTYKCEANNSVGAGSTDTTFTVQVPASVTIENDTDLVVEEDDDVTLVCNVFGFPSPNVSWVNALNEVMEDGNIWRLYNIRRNMRGQYNCSASNACGSHTKNVHIDVQYEPENVTLNIPSGKVCAGRVARLTCTAGAANPAVQNYTLYKNSAGPVNTRTDGVFYQTLHAKGQYHYSCQASNLVGKGLSKPTIVEVEVPASVVLWYNTTDVNASVVLGNSTVVVKEGENVTLVCNTSGFPSPNVSWVNASNYVMNASSVLRFPKISRHSSGNYSCSASNACGNDSKIAQIDVQYPAYATGSGENASVSEGAVKQFSCPVDGNPEPSITWYSGGQASGTKISSERLFTPSEEGCYTCSATNSLGNSDPITQCLTVIGEPTSTTRTPETTTEGGNVVWKITLEVTNKECDNFDEKAFFVQVRTVLNSYRVPVKSVDGTVRCGSVIVDLVLQFNQSVKLENVTDTLKIAAASNDEFGEFTVNPNSIKVTPDSPSKEPVCEETFSRKKDCSMTLELIIVIVVGCVLLFVFVVGVFAWWIHKRRARR